MAKSEIKKNILIFIVGIIDVLVTVGITKLFGIYNIVVIKSFSLIYGDFTWESFIFIGLALSEAIIFEYVVCKSNHKKKNYTKNRLTM